MRRDEFRLAFAGATIHDMFNWLSVIVWLPVEIASSRSFLAPIKVVIKEMSDMLYHFTNAITNSINLEPNANSNPQFLTIITKPLTNKIVQVRTRQEKSCFNDFNFFFVVQLDKKVIQNIALGKENANASLLKRYCSFKNESDNETFILVPHQRCSFLFANVNWADWLIGLILLIISIFILCLCLFALIKVLQSLVKGTVKNIIYRMVNSDFPGVLKYLTPYLAMLVKVATDFNLNLTDFPE